MSDFEDKARKAAIAMVGRLEQQVGDPNKIQAEIIKYGQSVAGKTGEDAMRVQREVELARAYMAVSDGKGGVLRTGASSVALRNWDNAQKGMNATGQILVSQQWAAQHNRADLMTERMQEKFGAVKVTDTRHDPQLSHGKLRGLRGHASVGGMVMGAALSLGAALLGRQLFGHDSKPEGETIDMSRLTSSLGPAEPTAPASPVQSPAIKPRPTLEHN